MNVLMVRAGWPSPICDQMRNGVHGWTTGTEGVLCAHCYELVRWTDCPAYMGWSRYLMNVIGDVERLN